MSETSIREGSAPSPYPKNRVLGIADEPSTVRAVIMGLADAGVPEESVEIVCGATAMRALNEYREQHGFKSWLVRTAQALSDERDAAERYEEAIGTNRFLVVAPATSADRAQEVGDVMRARGGHFVNYYGPSTITTIAP
jgi:hypothetical protein